MAKIHVAMLIGVNRTHSIFPTLFLCTSALLAFGCSGDEQRPKNASPSALSEADREKEIQKILAAEHGQEVAKGYAELFRQLGPDEMRALKKHKNHGVALRAAWEEVRLTVPKEPSKTAMPVEADALERFLAFAKDRLFVPVPSWWRTTLLSAESYQRENIVFRGWRVIRYEVTGAGFRAKPGVTVERRGKELLLNVGEASVAIPASIAEEYASFNSYYVSANIGPTSALLAIHSQYGAGYPLFCLDRNSSKVAWKTKVWADGGGISYGGRHFHNVTVSGQEKQITVFGGGNGQMYVEAFNAEDGTTLYRFCTGY